MLRIIVFVFACAVVLRLRSGCRRMMRGAKRFLGFLCAAALVSAAQAEGLAEHRACRLTGWGYGHVAIEQFDQEWVYSLTVVGPNWRHDPFGYHAPGHLSCQNCSSDAKGAGGLYYFFDQSGPSRNDSQPPQTASERMSRRVESVGYPGARLGAEMLAIHDSREGVRLGRLAGYAILYRVSLRPRDNDPSADGGGLLVVSLSDGCITFDATLMVGLGSGGGDTWAPLDSLLGETSIVRTSAADFVFPSGYRIRPRREGAQPR